MSSLFANAPFLVCFTVMFLTRYLPGRPTVLQRVTYTTGIVMVLVPLLFWATLPNGSLLPPREALSRYVAEYIAVPLACMLPLYIWASFVWYRINPPDDESSV